MKDLVTIVHNDYNKISDRIMWLSPNYVLRFNVDLYINRKTPTGKVKDNFHKEYGYSYDNKFGIKIFRDFNYYLSIESVGKEVNDKLVIGPNYIYFFKFKLDNMINDWFRANQIFAKQDGVIFIPVMPESVIIRLDFGNTIEFKPAVQDINSEQIIGVVAFANNSSDGFFLNIDDLLSFNYFISNFNMYESAQLMLNYVGRPSYGTNLYTNNTLQGGN